MHNKQFLTDSSNSKPLVTCSYGWKRTFTLYQDRIDVDGTMYALDDLVHVGSVYRTVMNIPSARIELRFRKKDVIFRGIAAIEDAKRVVEYLETYCADIEHATSRLRWNRTHQRTPMVQPQHTPAVSMTDALETVSKSLLPHVNSAMSATDRNIQEHTQSATAPVETPNWLRDLEQHVIYTREQQRVKAHRSVRKYGFDVQELAQQVGADTLPSVAVPLRLLPQETAHYCTNVTLSSETPLTSRSRQMRSTYTATDHGKLILTSNRMIYIGRTGQLVLDYNRLIHVSRLRNALAFSADHWSKRHVFEMNRPLECVMYLDNILRQFQQQSAQREAQIVQQPANKSALQHTYPSRTTQPRYAAHSREITNMPPVKPALELADVETLPLSLLKHVEMEIL